MVVIISLKNRYAGFGMGAFILSTLFAPSALAEAISLPQWHTHDFVFNTKNKTTEPFELEFYATFKTKKLARRLMCLRFITAMKNMLCVWLYQ